MKRRQAIVAHPSCSRVCVASQSHLGLTDTFIRAHIERLPFSVTHLSGYHLDYIWEGKSLRSIYEARPRSIAERLPNLLPRFLEFRLRERLFPSHDDADIVADFLKERQVDVVLAEYGTTAAFITPACAKAGIPLVAHFHGFDASHSATINQFREAYVRMFAYATAVIAVSNALRSRLIALGCPSDKIVLNHYGPHPAFFSVTPSYHSNTILAVGRLTEQKAPYLTLLAFKRALERCPELQLLMIGAGELSGVCSDLVAALELEGSVTLAGSAGPNQIREAMASACMFVQHSVVASDGNREGTPVAVLEASAAGLPIVSTQHEGIPDVVCDGETGILVVERDIRSMSDAIVALANDRGRLRSLGENARIRTKTLFTMERHISSLAGTLRSACESVVSEPA
jgi:glycosyltransferase involved in cell wall biosynthesis